MNGLHSVNPQIPKGLLVRKGQHPVTRPHCVETVGGDNGRNSSFPVWSLTFPKGYWPLKTADGKTKTIKSCEDRREY